MQCFEGEQHYFEYDAILHSMCPGFPLWFALEGRNMFIRKYDNIQSLFIHCSQIIVRRVGRLSLRLNNAASVTGTEMIIRDTNYS